jgi:hypothetical protein
MSMTIQNFSFLLHRLSTSPTSRKEKGRERVRRPSVHSSILSITIAVVMVTPFNRSLSLSLSIFSTSKEHARFCLPVVYYICKCERKKLRTDGRKRDIADVGLVCISLLQVDWFFRKTFLFMLTKEISIRVFFSLSIVNKRHQQYFITLDKDRSEKKRHLTPN